MINDNFSMVLCAFLDNLCVTKKVLRRTNHGGRLRIHKESQRVFGERFCYLYN